MIFWYDRHGKPLPEPMNHVEKLLRNPKYKVVAQDDTPDGKYWISTVWLGLDHSFSWFGDEPNPHPVIFETMVFPGNRKSKNSYREMYMERYQTEAEAAKGHARILKLWTAKEAARGKIHV